MNVRSFIAILVVMLFSFNTLGCNVSTTVSTLQTVINVAEVAIPVVGAAANLPPGLADQLVSYLEVVSSATSKASVILADPTLTDVQKGLEVSSVFSGLVAPVLPDGTPKAVANVISSVANAVAKFLSQFQAKSVAQVGKSTKTPLKPNEVKELHKIKTRADAAVTTLQEIKKQIKK